MTDLISRETAAKVAEEHEDDMGYGKGTAIAAAIRALPTVPPAGTDAERAAEIARAAVDDRGPLIGYISLGNRWVFQKDLEKIIAAALTATRQAALAEVVEWLRTREVHTEYEAVMDRETADQIERGDHLNPDPGQRGDD